GFESGPGGTIYSTALPALAQTEQVVLGRREATDHIEFGFSRDSLRGVDLDADGLLDVVSLPPPAPDQENPWDMAPGQAPVYHANVGDRLVPLGSSPTLARIAPGLGRITLAT